MISIVSVYHDILSVDQKGVGGLTIPFCVGNSPGFIPSPRHVETCWNWTSLYKDPSSGHVQTFHYEALNGRWPPNRAFTVICSNLLCFLRYIGSVQQSLHLLHHRALRVRVFANCNKQQQQQHVQRQSKRNWMQNFLNYFTMVKKNINSLFFSSVSKERNSYFNTNLLAEVKNMLFIIFLIEKPEICISESNSSRI